jgi:hypothetical protein
MRVNHQSPAVTAALAHVEAWSNHDFDTARAGLAADVKVIAITTQPIMKPTDLTGVDHYMAGLIEFASAVVPGSARIVTSLGDVRNALLTLTVQADFGTGPMTLPGSRLYLFDDDGKIQSEQVIFFATPA